MSKLFIEDTSLVAIGDAIREKTGSTNTMSPAQMATAILGISGGGSGGGSIKYVQLTNEDGTQASQVFDASAYIGTNDDKAFFLVLWSNYGSNLANACQPCILYYDGAGTYTEVLTSANSMNVSYFINPTKCKLEAGVITLTRNGSTYFNLRSGSGTTNYAELLYVE